MTRALLRLVRVSAPVMYLTCINDLPVVDIIDYERLTAEESIELTLCADGAQCGKQQKEFKISLTKEEYEPLGLNFETSLMSPVRQCANHCIFCFIDQMPKGMRENLYFKDDDSRLSFLQGNYITLTNMSEHDIDRIIRYHLAPINISIQTMNPELRCMMLHNRFAGEALKKFITQLEKC